MIDLRYMSCRQQHVSSEQRLLHSISEQGIREPLLGAMEQDVYILLDGFKRWRCAKKLAIHQLPFRIIGEDEAQAIIALMRRANAQNLTIIEQARLIIELHKTHGLSNGDIARRLERSPSWVSVRSHLLAEMRPAVADKILKGDFPAYAYMYTMRQFMRINKVGPDEIEAFVLHTAGRGLSLRDINTLAAGYFRGGEHLRREIAAGNVSWSLEALKKIDSVTATSLSVHEQRAIGDLEVIFRKMKWLIVASDNPTLTSHGFYSQAGLLCGGVLRLLPTFTEKIRGLHDRSRPEDEHHSSI